MTRESMACRAVAILAFGFAAATASAQPAAPLAADVRPAGDAAVPLAAHPDGGFSLRPFLSNALGNRHDVVAVETGAPGGGSYIEHVPQAAGVTLRAPF